MMGLFKLYNNSNYSKRKNKSAAINKIPHMILPIIIPAIDIPLPENLSGLLFDKTIPAIDIPNPARAVAIAP